jgi:hypothetical protein
MLRQKQMTDAIADADQGTIADADIEELVKSLSDQFSMSVPELIEGAISLTAEEAQADVTGNIRYGAFGSGPHFVPGVKVTYYVPFSGDKQMFECKPNTWAMTNCR